MPDFNPLARPYHLLERLAFQNALQTARTAHLASVAQDARNVLIVGEGDGRFLASFRQLNPHAQVTVLDLSQSMLALARQRDPSPHTTFIHADITTDAPPPGPYDLLVTHFLLDCFDQPTCDAVIATLADAATPNAHWLLADFHLPAEGLPRLQAQLWLKTMYTFFRLTTGLQASRLPNPLPTLSGQGFHPLATYRSRLGLISSIHLTRFS